MINHARSDSGSVDRAITPRRPFFLLLVGGSFAVGVFVSVYALALSFGGATWPVALEWAVGDAVIMAGIFLYSAQKSLRSNLIVNAVLGALMAVGYFSFSSFSLSHMASPPTGKVTLAHFLNLMFVVLVPYYFGRRSDYVAFRIGEKLPLAIRRSF